MLSYLIFALTIGGIYALLALSLNLVWGSAGMVNLGLAGFFGVGAYASAIATGAGAPVVFGWGGGARGRGRGPARDLRHVAPAR